MPIVCWGKMHRNVEHAQTERFKRLDFQLVDSMTAYQTRRCIYCGDFMTAASVYCGRCGNWQAKQRGYDISSPHRDKLSKAAALAVLFLIVAILLALAILRG